jgi:hypothetical protein
MPFSDPQRRAAYHREYARQWRRANPDKARASEKRWRTANRERVRERMRKRNKARYHADIEAARAKCRAAYQRIRTSKLERARLRRLSKPKRPKKTPADVLAYRRAWRHANPDKVAAEKRRERARNPDKVRERDRKRVRQIDPIKARERARRWRDANPDKVREHGIRNQHCRRARVRGCEGRHTNKEWQAVLLAHGNRCHWCGAKGTQQKPLTRDHYVPLCRGGTNAASNIVPSCLECNVKKGRKDPIDYARSLGFLL